MGSFLRTYALGLLAVLIAVLVRWMLDPVMGDTLPLVTLFGAVAAAVWLGGYRLAIPVALIGYLACLYLFIEPRGHLDLTRGADRVGRDSADSLAMLLEITRNKTYVAHDGVEAVEAIEKYRPEVVLLDIGLPRLDGHEVCRRVREQPWGKDMVMFALTGWGQEDDRRKSEEAGFNGHFVKPVDYDKLLELLSSLTTRSASTR